MWVSRAHYDLLVTSQANLHDELRAFRHVLETEQEERVDLLGQLEQARAMLADVRALSIQQRATLDWLTQHVNRLEAERALLVHDRLHVSLPVPEIARVESDARPAMRREPVGAPLPDPDIASAAEEGVDSLGVSQLLSASLEDVGDELAARLGVTHDADGVAHYTR